MESCSEALRTFQILSNKPLASRGRRAGMSPAKFRRGSASGVEKGWPTSIRSSRRVQGWAWEEEWVTRGEFPHGGRGGGGGELVGGRFPGEEGGQVLVQQLQQEERKLLG
jgi:hypothetical protein